MENYPQELAQDAVCQSHTGHMTGLWFLPTRLLRLNSNEWMNFHKYWTEIHDVTTIWKMNICSFIVALNAFDVLPQSGTSYKICLRGVGGNGSIAWTSAVSHVGRTSNAFKVTMKLQTFLFQMVVTLCISVQNLWKYGFCKILRLFIHTLYKQQS